MGNSCDTNNAVDVEARPIIAYVEHQAGINCMAASDDRTMMATASDDRTIKVHALRSDPIECLGTLVGHEGYITSLVFVDQFLFSGAADKSIRKWSLISGDCVHAINGAHRSKVNKLIYAASIKMLFSCSTEPDVKAWDADSCQHLKTFTGHYYGVMSILFLPGKNIHRVVNHSDSPRELENSLSGSFEPPSHVPAEEKSPPPPPPPPRPQSALSSKTTDSQDELEHSQNPASVAAETDAAQNQLVPETEPEIEIDLGTLVTASADATIKLWNVATGECRATFTGHKDSVTCMILDPTGKLLISGSADNTIRVWKLDSGDLVRAFVGHTAAITALSVWNRTIFSGSADSTVKTWSVELDELREFTGHKGSIQSLYVEHGILFTAGGDGLCFAYNASNGKRLQCYNGHKLPLTGLVILGTRFFTASYDAGIKMWSLTDLPERLRRSS